MLQIISFTVLNISLITKMDEEILKIFKGICEANDLIIHNQGGKNVQMLCFAITKEKRIIAIIPQFSNREEKENCRQFLFKKLASMELLGYILIMNTNMSYLNVKTGKIERKKEAVIRNLITPSKSIMEIVEYEGNRIKKKEFIDNARSDKNRFSNWDLWEEKELR